MFDLFSFQLQFVDLLIIGFVALCTGMAKTGVHGAGMMAVPLLAYVFGGQLSSGVMLPILIFSDIFGVWYYHKHAEWKYLKILFPWAAAGVVIGTITGNYINDESFRIIMASIIMVSIIVMVWLDHIKENMVIL